MRRDDRCSNNPNTTQSLGQFSSNICLITTNYRHVYFNNARYIEGYCPIYFNISKYYLQNIE